MKLLNSSVMEIKREKDSFERNKYKFDKVSSGKIGHEKDGFLHISKKDLARIHGKEEGDRRNDNKMQNKGKGKKRFISKNKKFTNKRKWYTYLITLYSLSLVLEDNWFPHTQSSIFLFHCCQHIAASVVTNTFDFTGMGQMSKFYLFSAQKHFTVCWAAGKENLVWNVLALFSLQFL